MTIRTLLLASTVLALAGGALAQEPSTPPVGTYKATIPPSQRRAYFGELHLHTAMSFDAWTFGAKVTPDQAFKFARGETVMVPAIQVAREQGIPATADVPAKRAWPLDFTAVTDHSEQMGVLTQLDDPDNALAKTADGPEDAGRPRRRLLHHRPRPEIWKGIAGRKGRGGDPARLGSGAEGGQ